MQRRSWPRRKGSAAREWSWVRVYLRWHPDRELDGQDPRIHPTTARQAARDFLAADRQRPGHIDWQPMTEQV
ncbi:hypothetical protein GCM10009779_30260 [Polymorphospora rubra]